MRAWSLTWWALVVLAGLAMWAVIIVLAFMLVMDIAWMGA